MNQDTKKEKMITRQTFYLFILISLTLGFLIGTAYTSFKLADSRQPGMRQMPPGMMGNMPKGLPAPEKGTGQDQKPDLATMADPHIKELQAFLKENPGNAQAWIMPFLIWTVLGMPSMPMRKAWPFSRTIHMFSQTLG